MARIGIAGARPDHARQCSCFAGHNVLWRPLLICNHRALGTHKSLELQVIPALKDQVEPVPGNIMEDLSQAARPAHLDLVDTGAASESEVGSQIALRHESPAALDLANL